MGTYLGLSNALMESRRAPHREGRAPKSQKENKPKSVKTAWEGESGLFQQLI